MKVLDDPKRSSIRTKLAGVIGDEDAESLVSALPSEGDDIVTKDFLRAELAQFSVVMEDKFVTKDFLRAELTQFSVAMEDKFATKDFFRGELAEKFAGQDKKFAGLDEKFAAKMDSQLRWMVGTMIVLFGITMGFRGSDDR